MAMNSKVGSFNIDTTKTAGQAQSITGVGFQPKIVLFWWGGSTGTGDTVSAGTYNLGFGAGISNSSRFCIVAIGEDAQGVSDEFSGQNNTYAITAYTAVGTQDGIADFESCDADGFTLTIDDQFTQAYRVSYLALGGTDLTNVYIGNKQVPASAGNYDITSVGFQPDAVITATVMRDAVAGGVAKGILALGMATGASNQGIVALNAADNVETTSTQGYGYNGEVIAERYTNRHAFVSFGADGFTLNCLEYSNQFYFHFICLKGGQYSVGDITTKTDGTDIAETVGFQPVALLFASANRALSTQDAYTNNARISIGAGTSTSNRACAAISNETGLADTETAYANYDSAVYAQVVDDAAVGLMDIKSIDASGFTCVMDDTDPSGCWVTYLAIGATGGAISSTSPIFGSDYGILFGGLVVR